MSDLILLGCAVALFALWRSHTRLKRRFEALETAYRTEPPQVARLDPAEVAEPESPAPIATTELVGPPRKATWAGPTEVMPPEPPRLAQFEQSINWLRENWVLVAGTVSLAFAGLFLVQYGAEHGYLTPVARVLCAIALGMALLGAGEYLRRRFGDDTDSATRLLPSALAGAGVLTLFTATLAARGLYNLIDPGTAFAALAVISVTAIGFGWLYGPFLSVVGIVGALAAPYLVGGQTDAPWLLSYYFAVIAVTALAIDSIKRLVWLSMIGLIGATASVWLIYLQAGFPEHFLIATLLVTVAALVIPERQFPPALTGVPTVGFFLPMGMPRFPTVIGFLAIANAVVAATAVGLHESLAYNIQAITCLGFLCVMTLFWLARSPALTDTAALPILGFLAVIGLQPGLDAGMYTDFVRPLAEREAPPNTVWYLIAIAAIGSILGFVRLRSTNNPLFSRLFSIGSALLTTTTVFVLEFIWAPESVYGTKAWATAIVLAAVAMAILSRQSARLSHLSEPLLYAALYTSSALVLAGLALFVTLTKTALTLALALMVCLVVQLDRRFNLPLIPLVAKVGLVIIGYRTVVDPGVLWALSDKTDLFDATLAYVGPLLILLAARVLTTADRRNLQVSIEASLWVLFATLGCVLLVRLLPGHGIESHWGTGLMAGLWLLVSVVQLRQIQEAGNFEKLVRFGIAGAVGLLVVGALAALFIGFNPLLSSREKVVGIPFLSSLALAFLPCALVLGLAAWRLVPQWRYARIALSAVAGFFVACYLALSIRHLWQGPELSGPGVLDAELYSYTLAMLVVSATLLVVAFLQRNTLLRTVAMGGVALTIGKVFLIDMADLTGLIRVVSFLGLGISLIGLTWLSRVMDAQWTRDDSTQPGD